jgi:hypothetical protein
VLNEDDEEDENDYNERYDSEAEEEDDDDDDNGTIARFLSASVLLSFFLSFILFLSLHTQTDACAVVPPTEPTF